MGTAAQRTVIVGPPGTGKTTRLLEILDEERRRVPLEAIGFLAFTRQAAYQAGERLGEEPESLPYFRTLHSFCYMQLGLNRGQVFGHRHEQKFCEEVGIDYKRGASAVDGDLRSLRGGEGNLLFHLDSLARGRQMDLEDVCQLSAPLPLPAEAFLTAAKHLANYKARQGVLDFTDMLEDFARVGVVPRLEVLFVDEAQDLSALQWVIVEKIIREGGVRRVYFAGDDDQAIYTWAGADVSTFVNLEGEEHVLHHSHRVPHSVQRLALQVVKEIGERREKVWESREGEGQLQYALAPEHVDFSQGEWLILARNSYLLKPVAALLKRRGLLYNWHEQPSVTDEELKAIRHWERYRQYGSSEDLEIAWKHLPDELPARTVPWYQALNLNPVKAEYIRSSLRQGERLFDEPRITLSTVHRTKGDERDNVLLLSDYSYRTARTMCEAPDDEWRVAYVGVTRCREKLVVVRPRTRYHYTL